MRVPSPRGRAAIAVIIVVVAGSLAGAEAPSEALFREPLHLTRELFDSISGTTATLDEYCVGDRVVSVRGARSSIADYRAATLTEIDRAAGTYSVTSFDAIARAQSGAGVAARRDLGEVGAAELVEEGVRGVGARTGRAFRARVDTPQAKTLLEVVVDRELLLSREAVEVLVGASYPAQRSTEADLALRASARAGDSSRTLPGGASLHALPLEQVVTWKVDGESVERAHRVLRVGRELPPLDVVAIPPGARLVESPIVLRAKRLDELDTLPGAVQPR